MSTQPIFEKKLPQGILTMRYPTLEDAECMQHYFNILSAEKTYIRSQGTQVSLEEEKAFVENVLKNIQAKKSVRLLAFLNDSLIGISNIDLSFGTEKHLGELGISLAKEHRGKGLGNLMMQVLIEEAIKQLPELEIITLYVFAPNLRAITLYKKLGFIEYGSLPKGVKFENSYVDCIYMYRRVRNEK